MGHPKEIWIEKVHQYIDFEVTMSITNNNDSNNNQKNRKNVITQIQINCK